MCYVNKKDYRDDYDNKKIFVFLCEIEGLKFNVIKWNCFENNNINYIKQNLNDVQPIMFLNVKICTLNNKDYFKITDDSIICYKFCDQIEELYFTIKNFGTKDNRLYRQIKPFISTNINRAENMCIKNKDVVLILQSNKIIGWKIKTIKYKYYCPILGCNNICYDSKIECSACHFDPNTVNTKTYLENISTNKTSFK